MTVGIFIALLGDFLRRSYHVPAATTADENRGVSTIVILNGT